MKVMNYESNVVTLLSFAFISLMTDWEERITVEEIIGTAETKCG